MSPRGRATLAGFAAVLLWSSLAVLTTATGSIPPFQLLAMGFGIAGLAGVALLLRPGGPGAVALRQPWAAGALGIGALFGYHALYFVALKRAPAVEANLINYLWPLLIVVFAALSGGARVRMAQWLGTGLGLAAAVLLVTRGQSLQVDPAHAPGYAAALGAAVIWALYSVLNRRFEAVPSAAMAGSCLVVGVLGGIAHLLFETTVVPTAGQWALVVALGLGPTGIAFWLWDIGTKRGDLAVLGTLSYAAPLLSTGLLLAFGRATPHWTQAAAVALLLTGAWLSLAARPTN
jgi:drug/metabolite transporter (DMT)-like permease